MSSMNDKTDGGDSLLTVVVAGGANLAIAVAKLVAGLVGGSASMLSEAAHSAADTVTEVLLFTAIKRGEKPADRGHPLGYGNAAFLWALIAACFTLVVGAGFSVTHGFHTIFDGEELTDFTLSYVVLAVSFVLEGVSMFQGLRQLRQSASRWETRPFALLRRTSDTMLKAVVLEDSAALAGIVIAGAGLGLTQLTGNTVFDGIGSVLIGLLLLFVAVTLIRANASLLLNRSASPALEGRIREHLEVLPEVERIVELLTVLIGPNRILVAARIDFVDEATGAALEAASATVERTLRSEFPEIREVFLDPTSSAEDRP
ncbi:cation diffusion facilitator family transporter [Herbidospora sp. RD11066]